MMPGSGPSSQIHGPPHEVVRELDDCRGDPEIDGRLERAVRATQTGWRRDGVSNGFQALEKRFTKLLLQD